jgi:outer membrane protein assembly factor BamB
VYALDGATGTVRWTQRLDAGVVPSGFVAPTPLLANNRVHLGNPLASQVLALDVMTGATLWKTAVTTAAGRYAWGPGAMLGSAKLLQPAGSALYTLDAASGALLKQYAVGGAFTYNSPTVLGKTVYIGNSFGWVMGIPLADVGG